MVIDTTAQKVYNSKTKLNENKLKKYIIIPVVHLGNINFISCFFI